VTAPSVIDVPVLVVGAGPTGLSASLLLSRHGIESLTIERHPGTSIYPRATGINARTMEVFRALGVEGEVRDAAFTAVRRMARSAVLVDDRDLSLAPMPVDGMARVSPSVWTSCSQYELEPILARAAAAQSSAQLQFGTELVGFENTDRGITAQIVDQATDQVSEVRCRFLIAADGARSRIRQRLGIEMHGPGALMENLSIHFRAPLRRLLGREPDFLHFVANGPGVFAPTDNESRWMFAVPGVRELAPTQAIELVRAGSGVPDLEVEILGMVPWTMQADWAESWRSGNIFLAGDAAHRMTPAGGHGLNTGVQDVHNLCWKIAAVLQGWAGPELLDTYQVERLPVARFNATRSVTLVTGEPQAAERSEADIDLGFVYESSAVIRDGDNATSARPGARAPHMWMGKEKFRTSTLDLFGPRFTLLAGSQDGAWCQAGKTISRERGIPMAQRKMFGRPWHSLYGVGEAGAVLVRPDGHVAWRRASPAADHSAELRTALSAILAVDSPGLGSSDKRRGRGGLEPPMCAKEPAEQAVKASLMELARTT
jgi:putative polyketide hydroxylase